MSLTMKKPGLGIHRQAGYMLLSVMLLVTIMLITLSIALPRISQQIKREKEEELVSRGKQYAIAIKKFYRKNGTYPVSLEQLESTNNLRFLRQRYKDPMTIDGEWKLVHLGEAQINIPNTPSAVPQAQPGQTGSLNTNSPTNTMGAQPNNGFNPGGGLNNTNSGLPGSNPGQNANQPGANPPGTAQMGTLTVQSMGSGGGPIIGVASKSTKTGIKEFNGTSAYNEWLFVYEPRLEAVPGAGGVVIAAPTGANTADPVSQTGNSSNNPAPTATPQRAQ